MGAKPTTIGGGSARGVSDEFSQMLHQAMSGGFNTGGSGAAGAGAMGANPMGDTMNMQDMLGQLVSGGMGLANNAAKIGANRREADVGDIRSRYMLGGTGYGTPASVGESRFLGEFDPQLAGQIGGLQMDGISKALGFLFPSMQQAYDKGIPQAQTVMKPSGFTNFVSGLSQLGGVAAQFMPGSNPLGAGSNAGGAPSMSQGQLGQASNYSFPGSQAPVSGAGSFYGGFGAGRDTFGTPDFGSFGGNGRTPYNPWAFNNVWGGNL